jgi:hypothetical protein
MITYTRPYLWNDETLDLVTVQSRAWNDTVGCLMWIKIQLKAYKVFVCVSLNILFLGKIFRSD